MKQILKNLLIFSVIVLFSSQVFARQAPTRPNSYDGFGLGTRALAMGHTGAADPGSLDGVYYNSAALGFNDSENVRAEASFFVLRNTALSDNDYYFFSPNKPGFTSFTVSQKQGAISWRTLSSYEMSDRNGDDFYKKTESIKAVTFSMANKTESGTSIGMNLSYLYGTITESSVTAGMPFARASSGNGFSMDIGFMSPLKENIFFGLNLENIIGFMWWNEYNHDQLPFGIRTGFGYITKAYKILFDYNRKFYRSGSGIDYEFISAGLEKPLTPVFTLFLGAQAPSAFNKEKLKTSYGVQANISSVCLSAACENYKMYEEKITQYYFSVKVEF